MLLRRHCGMPYFYVRTQYPSSTRKGSIPRRDRERVRYNGWENHATWATYSWLSSDEVSYADCLHIARSGRTRYEISNAIREYVSDANPLADSASLYTDLLSGALGSVDWNAIAEGFEPDTEDDEFDDHDFDMTREETDWDASQEPVPPFEARFSLGRTLVTAQALAACEIAQIDPADLMARHHAGDWGNLDPEDLRANETALKEGGRLLSCYALESGQKIYVITEADRLSTTLLLPGDY